MAGRHLPDSENSKAKIAEAASVLLVFLNPVENKWKGTKELH